MTEKEMKKSTSNVKTTPSAGATAAPIKKRNTRLLDFTAPELNALNKALGYYAKAVEEADWPEHAFVTKEDTLVVISQATNKILNHPDIARGA